MNAISLKLSELQGKTSKNAFAKKCGLPFSTMNTYLEGKSIPGLDIALKIALANQVSIDWLAGLTENKSVEKVKTSSHNCNNDSTVSCYIPSLTDLELGKSKSIPLISAETIRCAGQEYSNGHLFPFKVQMFKDMGVDPNNILIMSIRGDAMSPSLKHGDLVLIDKGNTEVRDNALYAITVNEDLLIRRLQHLPGKKIKVIADNKQEVEPFELPLDELDVVGKLIWLARTFSDTTAL